MNGFRSGKGRGKPSKDSRQGRVKPTHVSSPTRDQQKKSPLRDGPAKGDRARWVVGIHSCEEALKVRPGKVREIWLRDDWASSQQLRDVAELAEKFKVPLKSKSTGQLDQIGSGHQGVALAVTESPEVDWANLEAPGAKLVLVLDGIEDPHNLGSMLRTAWLTGVSAIFIPTDRAVGLTPAACKVASGGAEHVPVESEASLPSLLQKLKDAGFWIYGLAEKGTRKPWEFQFPEKVAWVVGSEGSGMRVPTERACDELVRLPQVETGSSYNASIALAMALAETCRQLGMPK